MIFCEVCAHGFEKICYIKYRKNPPIHYIVFATPIRRNTFSKKDSVSCPFYVAEIYSCKWREICGIIKIV